MADSSILELFEQLKINVENNSNVEDVVRKLCEQLNMPGDNVSRTLKISTNTVNQLNIILEKDPKVGIGVAEIVASLAKSDARRETLTNERLVSQFCKWLGQLKAADDDTSFNLVKQSCRALGNLCYENDKCRKYVQDNNGLKIIMNVVRQAIELGKISRGAELRSYSVGLLLNFVAGCEELEIVNLRTELIDLLCGVLECGVSTKEDETAAVHCMMMLGFFEVANNPVLNDRLCNIFVNLLQESTSGELVEFCVELIHSQAEHPQVSLNLAKAGMCELLVQLLEKHKNLAEDADTENLFKMACDLIIIILNEDKSMELLFNKGLGNVFKSMVSWLSSNVKELQISGVLAIGNFARADTHCIEMVKQGVSKQLIMILSKNNTNLGDTKLQHALLSALRNLVIPDQNKSIVVKEKLLETLYPMVSVKWEPVIFKLLGTFRIVMDKQELVAQELVKNETLLDKVVEWCGNEHPGVQGESSRFLAWLVKNCRNESVADTMIQLNAVPCLIQMIASDHEVMQNEALIAVTIISTVRLEKVETILRDQNIASKITTLITTKKPKREVFSNLLTMIRQLAVSKIMKDHLVQSGILKILNEYVGENADLMCLKKDLTDMAKLLEYS